MVEAMANTLRLPDAPPVVMPPRHFKVVKTETLPLTREVAETFKNLEPSPTERELDPKRIKHLKAKADNGLLVPFHWARATTPDGRLVRMNGQHSSTMLCELNGHFPTGLFVTIEDYEVFGSDGLGWLFKQFDDRKSVRSLADVAGSWQGLQPALREVARPTGKIGIEGAAWYLRTIEGIPVGEDIYYLFNRTGLHDFLLWLNEILSIKTPELKRAAITAAIYATFIKDAADARKFWAEVARGGVEYEENAPASVLDAWLKSAKEGELKDDLKPAQYYQGCIYAWNAFREQKQLKDVRSDTRKGLHQPV
jgi:hypothetical protein